MTTRSQVPLSMTMMAFMLLSTTAVVPPLDRPTPDQAVGQDVPCAPTAGSAPSVPVGADPDSPPTGVGNRPVPTPFDSDRSASDSAASGFAGADWRAQGTPTVPERDEDPCPPAPSEILLRLFVWGAGMATLALLVFGAYTLLRGRARSYIARMRTRQQHRRRRAGRGQEGEQ